MFTCGSILAFIFLSLYMISQVIYFCALLVDLYLYSRPKDIVDMTEVKTLGKGDYPLIILLYPVLWELKTTMQTAFTAMAQLDYPKDRFRVISIPNASDHETIQSLKELQEEFDFLEVLEIPPTSDSSWQIVWDNWDKNEKVYWWHQGAHAKNVNLPPKKTRQLIYAFYHIAKEMEGKEDFLVNYIDADTCVPKDHFLAAAVGIRHYDVLQATNIAGNLNDTLAASCHAFDHFIWDGFKYPHLSAHGKHPYWVLGKALYYKSSDLLALGGFHPWIAIEDPEVGLRFWKNGKTLGIIEKPVIEEVPRTFVGGIIQRKRWVCGFFQTLSEPLTQLKMTPYEKLLSWCNFIPCLSLWTNSVSLPLSTWALIGYFKDYACFPLWIVVLSIFNIICSLFMLFVIYYNVWKRTALVLGSVKSRIIYLLRINPLVAWAWWVFWLIPICLGYRMYKGEGGLVWIPTIKINANAKLFSSKIIHWFREK
jgi:cellulose synthase/poly-beta-1,6-N-acetylglucosamine synthase-like glycosyltransferase